MKKHYTPKQYEKLLNSMTIIVDTAEKNNEHITQWFDKNNIAWKNRKLKTGDYNFMLPKDPDLGIDMDTYFIDDIMIERKNSVEELAGNLARSSSDDHRFLREVGRMKEIDTNYLLIEDSDISDLLNGRYRSSINATAMWRTILTIQKQTGLYLYFVPKEYMGRIIYELCKHKLDEKIMK